MCNMENITMVASGPVSMYFLWNSIVSMCVLWNSIQGCPNDNASSISEEAGQDYVMHLKSVNFDVHLHCEVDLVPSVNFSFAVHDAPYSSFKGVDKMGGGVVLRFALSNKTVLNTCIWLLLCNTN